MFAAVIPVDVAVQVLANLVDGSPVAFACACGDVAKVMFPFEFAPDTTTEAEAPDSPIGKR